MASKAANQDTPMIDADDREPCLQGLPKKLRNRILSLALITAADIEIKKGNWPGISLSCKQFRKEGLPIYLGHNSFVALINDTTRKTADDLIDKVLSDGERLPRDAWAVSHSTILDKGAFTFWMSIVKRLPASCKKFIKVTINYEGNMFDKKYGCTKDGRMSCTIHPKLDFWSKLIFDIKRAGLTSPQIFWPGMLITVFSKGRETISPCDLYLLNAHVLTPLLIEHGMFDKQRPPVDVAGEVETGIMMGSDNGRVMVM